MADYDLELGEVPPRRAPPPPGTNWEEFADAHHARNTRRRYAELAFKAATQYAVQKTMSSLISAVSHNSNNSNMTNLRTEMDMELDGTPSTIMTNATSTTNMTGFSAKTLASVGSRLTTHADTNSGKRGPSVTYRLHKAKYLKMDAMLKQLMFPLHRFKGIFGYVQMSGQGLNVAVPGTVGDLDKLAPRSAFRSISFFKLRHTAPRYITNYPNESVDNQSGVLNGKRNAFGSTTYTDDGSSQTTFSYFRRFCNRPNIQADPNGNPVNGAGGAPQTTPEGVSTMSRDQGNYRQMWMDYNCADMESAALQAQPFRPNPPQVTNNTGESVPAAAFDSPGTGPTMYQGKIGDFTLPYAWKDATMRIADGKLELDVQNGTRVPCILDLVIHSMKQSEPGGGKYADTARIYEAIWKANNAAYNENTNYNEITFTGAGANQAMAAQYGGWTSFWDPKTPFLAVKGRYKKQVSDIANEVHRSQHILAPGESKTITIMLGSLYYKIGNRTGMFPQDAITNNVLQCKEDGPGTLAVALGAAGIDVLEAIAGDGNTVQINATGAGAELEGAGFWVGKRPAPSCVVVNGKYEESWYPSYFDAKQQHIADTAAPLPSVVNKSEQRTLPLGTIAPIQVSAIDENAYFGSVGAGKRPRTEQSPATPAQT